MSDIDGINAPEYRLTDRLIMWYELIDGGPSVKMVVNDIETGDIEELEITPETKDETERIARSVVSISNDAGIPSSDITADDIVGVVSESLERLAHSLGVKHE